MFAEQEHYRQYLLTLPPEEIQQAKHLNLLTHLQT